MKKIICLILSLLLIMSLVMAMVVPAAAATPTLQTPSIPQVPKVKVSVQLPDDFWSNWFATHPLPTIRLNN